MYRIIIEIEEPTVGYSEIITEDDGRILVFRYLDSLDHTGEWTTTHTSSVQQFRNQRGDVWNFVSYMSEVELANRYIWYRLPYLRILINGAADYEPDYAIWIMRGGNYSMLTTMAGPEERETDLKHVSHCEAL